MTRRRHRKAAPAKSAKEWARLVRAWKRSGKSSEAFAASRGILAKTLVWWAWRLGQSGTGSPPSSRRQKDSLRLVEVAMERASPVSSFSWELRAPAGIHLMVHGELSIEALALVMDAKGYRP